MDKVGVAICELYDLYPSNKIVAFPSFWQLDKDNRRELFEKIKNPGLLALYSIATDLNDRKSGEWSYYKDWRNAMEHDFLVIHKTGQALDIYDSYQFMKEPIFVDENEFQGHLERLLQLTRSAIFSFVFSVREHANQTEQPGKLLGTISIDRTDRTNV